MLVLSRRQHQKIRLGDSIVITVVRVSGDKVRLGIEAPKDMVILREELESFGGDQTQEQPETAVATERTELVVTGLRVAS